MKTKIYVRSSPLGQVEKSWEEEAAYSDNKNAQCPTEPSGPTDKIHMLESFNGYSVSMPLPPNPTISTSSLSDDRAIARKSNALEKRKGSGQSKDVWGINRAQGTAKLRNPKGNCTATPRMNIETGGKDHGRASTRSPDDLRRIRIVYSTNFISHEPAGEDEAPKDALQS
ncbi:uncharacterized protein RSE6_03685 [Rhynchosporium secalis]|uniref:Uncharacterized protein n=1 Tax=Rhynchosporium secalis TaxID=38038 RepID=A0A1E1M3F1_RHYSE|nr:uncharacterized protein RSE6_03685 [Rhynchosporium secalis]